MKPKEMILSKLSTFSYKALNEMVELYTEHLAEEKEKKEKSNDFFTLPNHIAEQVNSDNYIRNEMQRSRIGVIRRLPTSFDKPNVSAKELVDNAYEVWRNNIVGLEDVFAQLLSHIIEYGKTMRTTPLLFIGEPGGGKTIVAKIYSEMLFLKCHFINAPRMMRGRGLSGESGSMQDAQFGELISGALETGSPNPVFVIDEIDKVKSFHGHGGEVIDELLSLLSGCEGFKDNFLELYFNFRPSPFVLTANYLNEISPPLLDRCDIVLFPRNSEEDVYNIMARSVIPNELERFDNQIEISNDTIETLVHAIFVKGITSIRPYERAATKLITNALVSSIESGKAPKISEDDIKKVIDSVSGNEQQYRKVGF